MTEQNKGLHFHVSVESVKDAVVSFAVQASIIAMQGKISQGQAQEIGQIVYEQMKLNNLLRDPFMGETPDNTLVLDWEEGVDAQAMTASLGASLTKLKTDPSMQGWKVLYVPEQVANQLLQARVLTAEKNPPQEVPDEDS